MNFIDLKKIDVGLDYLNGDREMDFTGISIIENPLPHELTFLKDRKFHERLGKRSNQKEFKNSCIVIDKRYWESGKCPEDIKKQFGLVLLSSDVSLSMAKVSKPFYEIKLGKRNNQVDGRQMGTCEIHPTALIAQNVFLGEGVKIGPHVEILSGAVVLSGSMIGEGTKIYPNVTLYDNVTIGKNCRVHSGVTIGGDGFGYHFSAGTHHKIWHTGGVIIGDDVEIGANSAIDGGTFAATQIGSGTKIDNHVQVAHNCKIGRGVILCGQVGLAGSSEVGDYTVFGGKAGLGPDVSVGKACQIAGSAMVNNDWPDGAVIAGHPARPLKEWMKGLAWVRKHSLNNLLEKEQEKAQEKTK